MGKSQYLAGLDAEQRARLEQKLLARQSGRCFICDQPIDLVLHKGQLDVDHIDPLIEDGLDAENNFAITHASCNRTKGASNLQIARRLAEFERLQEQAQEGGRRGANLGDVLQRHGGAKAPLRLRRDRGPEFIAKALHRWCRRRGSTSNHIEPGAPWQNPFVESYKWHLRKELLDLDPLDLVLEAQVLIDDWREEYKTTAPTSRAAPSRRWSSPAGGGWRTKPESQIWWTG